MIKLNGIDIPSNVIVGKIGFSILPPIENAMLNVRGKKGAYYMHQDFGTREITVSLTIVSEEINGVMADTRKLAEWLYSDEPMKLELADEPDKHYMVLLDGSTPVDETVNVGEVELKFICTEPYAFSEEKTFTFSPVDESPMGIVVNGSANTYGKFELEMKQNVTEISLISDNGFVTIGKPTQVDDAVVDSDPLQLWDEMSSINGWTSGIAVDGSISGELSSTGYAFKSSSFGTGSGWHGGALVKALPKALQDFEIHMDFALQALTKKEVGRVELYLFDANNNSLGKVSLADASPLRESQNFEARVGSASAGTYYVREQGKTAWTDFNGRITLKRIGRKWTVTIGDYDAKKKAYRSRLQKSYVTRSLALDAKLAKIQVHLGAYGTHKTMSVIDIKDIKVFERLTLGAGQVPIIAKVGDILTIDNEKAIVLKNGVPFYEGLFPDSKFFDLKKGTNGVVLSPASADVTVTFKERWL